MNYSKTTKENIARLNKSIDFIEKNLSQKLSLSLVAQQAFFSLYHFHRLFSVAVGETVTNYIIRKRIEKAASYLLHQKEKSITEISEEVGFGNLSSFSKAFKKYYGISPNEFKIKSSENITRFAKPKARTDK